MVTQASNMLLGMQKSTTSVQIIPCYILMNILSSKQSMYFPTTLEHSTLNCAFAEKVVQSVQTDYDS